MPPRPNAVKAAAKVAPVKKVAAPRAPATQKNAAAPAKAAPQRKSAAPSDVAVKKVVGDKQTAQKKLTPAAKSSASSKAVSPAKAAAPQKAAAAKVAASQKSASAKKVAPTKAAAPQKAAAAKVAAPQKAAPQKRVAAPRPTATYASDDKFLERQRQALLGERAVYVEQAQNLKAEAESLVEEMEPGDIQFDEESGEGGTLTVDRERDLVLSAQAQLAVEDIDDALRKLSRGRYGICEGCGELIGKPRLEAMPFARLCIACKSGGLSRR